MMNENVDRRKLRGPGHMHEWETRTSPKVGDYLHCVTCGFCKPVGQMQQAKEAGENLEDRRTVAIPEREWGADVEAEETAPPPPNDKQYVPAPPTTSPEFFTAYRRRLPLDRKSTTRVLRLDTLKVYVTVGEYPDGAPGEVFLRADKVGSIERGLLEALSLTISLALQHGVPLADLVSKYRNLNFSPQGLTGDADFPSASSIVDYLAQWLESRYGK